MNVKPINPRNLSLLPHDILEFRSMLLTSGNFQTGDFNMMTIGWGAFGTMWNKPLAMVVVRPTRYTFDFMEKYPDFTITAFPSDYRKALTLLGTKSGRDTRKLELSGLTPAASIKVASPTYTQAELSIECRKTYFDDFEPAHFLDKSIMNNYPERDFHRIYFGEIIHVEGIEKYAG
ncbi:MAG TPA: flavin reductase [Anaerolineaceae bacterium]|nr:flavin reductase [Anaerolineaceae bacterium]